MLLEVGAEPVLDDLFYAVLEHLVQDVLFGLLVPGELIVLDPVVLDVVVLLGQVGQNTRHLQDEDTLVQDVGHPLLQEGHVLLGDGDGTLGVGVGTAPP